jgi:phosphoribosylformylglycinamidine (FGAM) synthase-like enzyme
MSASAIDEAVRNLVAVGARTDRIAILDNFCGGNPWRTEILGEWFARPKRVTMWLWPTKRRSFRERQFV